MIAKKITRYYAECGKGYWNKQSCLRHESVCKCWTNPKFKTCKTCKYLTYESDDYTTWYQCINDNFDEEKHFTPAHPKAPNLNINCPVWESKKQNKIKI